MMQDLPITGVVIVTDPNCCPPGYTLIDKTYDRREDADLWKDGLFGRKITRYLCVERSQVTPGQNILVDVGIINEKDPPPAGFTCLEFTDDTREKAVKRKCLCVRWMSAELTKDGITELILLSKGSRRPPNGYSLVGDLNNLPLCYKMGAVATPSTPDISDPTNFNLSKMSSSLPYGSGQTGNIGNANPWNQQSNRGTWRRNELERTMSSISHSNPLSGMSWQLNPKLTGNNLNNLNLPEIKYKSLMEIENEYQYNFRIEQSARVPLDLS